MPKEKMPYRRRLLLIAIFYALCIGAAVSLYRRAEPWWRHEDYIAFFELGKPYIDAKEELHRVGLPLDGKMRQLDLDSIEPGRSLEKYAALDDGLMADLCSRYGSKWEREYVTSAMESVYRQVSDRRYSPPTAQNNDGIAALTGARRLYFKANGPLGRVYTADEERAATVKVFPASGSRLKSLDGLPSVPGTREHTILRYLEHTPARDCVMVSHSTLIRGGQVYSSHARVSFTVEDLARCGYGSLADELMLVARILLNYVHRMGVYHMNLDTRSVGVVRDGKGRYRVKLINFEWAQYVPQSDRKGREAMAVADWLIYASNERIARGDNESYGSWSHTWGSVYMLRGFAIQRYIKSEPASEIEARA